MITFLSELDRFETRLDQSTLTLQHNMLHKEWVCEEDKAIETGDTPVSKPTLSYNSIKRIRPVQDKKVV